MPCGYTNPFHQQQQYGFAHKGLEKQGYRQEESLDSATIPNLMAQWQYQQPQESIHQLPEGWMMSAAQGTYISVAAS